MKAQIVEQIEFFSEAELESLEFVPEELEDIEAERVPDLESISFEDIAEDLEATLEARPNSTVINALLLNPAYQELQTKIINLTTRINLMSRRNPERLKLIAQRVILILRLKIMEKRA